MFYWIEIRDLSPEQWEKYHLLASSGRAGPIVSSHPPLAAELETFKVRRVRTLYPLQGQECLLFREDQPEAWLRWNLVCGRMSFSPGGAGIQDREIQEEFARKMQEIMAENLQPYAWLEADSATLQSLAQAAGGAVSEQLVYLELDLNLTNWSAIESWVSQIPLQNPGFYLELHLDRPESILTEYISLYNQLSLDRPRTDLVGPPYASWNRSELTRLRLVNQEIGRATLTLLLFNPDREAVGLTDLNLDSAQPERAYQGMTGILPAYRGRGLGRWMKAAALQKLHELFPKVRFIDGDTHQLNQPMLKMNHEMGYHAVRQGIEFRLNLNPGVVRANLPA
ncbi:MAG: GNAT family N-acetyltransferase [Bacteroidia bacterium]|nr:GNAT family N-acetyltransferase [Bacteroidia bacterium]